MTDAVARTETAKEYTAGKRLYGNVEGDLLYAYDMAAVGQPLQPHLWARLQRAVTGRATSRRAARSSGNRLTPQRELILDAVDRLGHATPDEVLAEVRRQSTRGEHLHRLPHPRGARGARAGPPRPPQRPRPDVPLAAGTSTSTWSAGIVAG